MKYPAIFLLPAGYASALSASVSLFDNPADLEKFNVHISYGHSSNAADYTATGGLSGSGAIEMGGSYESQAWLYQDGFAFHPGVNYTVSAYIKTDSYAAIGFAASADELSDDLYPNNSVLIGINSASQYIDLNSTSSGNGAADQGYAWFQDTHASYAVGDWVYLSFQINFDGTDYLATYSATLSDSDGVLGDVIVAGTEAFSNNALDSSGTIYPFFYFDGGYSNPTIDNFAAVPEPTTVTALAGLTVLGAVLLRRRARS